MKKIYAAFVLLISINSSFADSWLQKASMTNNITKAASFSIGNIAYIGTGTNSSGLKQDFWQYDQSTGLWTQLAPFPGAARMSATGFSIGSKGYIGTGWDPNGGSPIYYADCYQYDTTSHAWSSIGAFPGGARQSAVAFTIGSKAYVGTGADINFVFKNDIYEFSPGSGWTAKAPLPDSTALATAFSIGNYGYIGLGQNDYGDLKSFYRYNPTTNSWTKMQDFGGAKRNGAVGFSIDGYGYIGTGLSGSYTTDFWQYDTTANSWNQKASLTGAARAYGVGFSIGGKGYIGTGNPGLKDLWEYTPDLPNGINHLEGSNSIFIYPNPASSRLWISASEIAGGTASLEIFNTMGMKVCSFKSEINNPQSAIHLDISNFAKGVYFVILHNPLAARDKENTWTGKFIKE